MRGRGSDRASSDRSSPTWATCYKAVGFRDMSFDDIRYFHAPIVPVMFHGYNHYVVVKGVAPDGALRVADPAYGNRTISRKKFEAAWIDGIAFVMMENGR